MNATVVRLATVVGGAVLLTACVSPVATVHYDNAVALPEGGIAVEGSAVIVEPPALVIDRYDWYPWYPWPPAYFHPYPYPYYYPYPSYPAYPVSPPRRHPAPAPRPLRPDVPAPATVPIKPSR